MRKIRLISALIFLGFIGNAQIPPGYYNATTGLTGYPLKTALKTIITNGHTDRGYGNLYTGYMTADADNFYDNDGSVLDMYSENPTGVDNYFYTHNNRKCGNYNSEDDCYNREHLMPQSVFSSASPMKNDIHFVVPSDGYVNGQRSNLPFGEVTSTTWTSQNGSKKGPCSFPGYSNLVFEPIDEFKGDIARCMLYFATRYESQVSSWSWGPLNGTSTQVYDQWFVNLLVKWHLQDTVNQREIVRNNASYTYQGNRNPYIDHPEWVTQIWTSTLTNISIKEERLFHLSIFPNPTVNHSASITNDFPIDKVSIYTILGKEISEYTLQKKSSNSIEISGLPAGVLLLKVASKESTAVKKLVVQ
jgi:endonuclease I